MIAAWVLALSAVRDFRAILQAGDEALSIVNVADTPPSSFDGTDTDDERTAWETIPTQELATAFFASLCGLVPAADLLPPRYSPAGDSVYCTVVATTGATGLLSPPSVAA